MHVTYTKITCVSMSQECLVRVAVWCIGEYGDMLVNNVGMLDIEDPITVSASSRSIYILYTLLVIFGCILYVWSLYMLRRKTPK